MSARVPAGWCPATYGDVLDELEDRAGERIDLPVLSVTKTRGPMLASERFAKVLHSRDLSRYRVAYRDVIVADPMLLWDGSIGIQRVVDAGLVSPDYRVYATNEKADVNFMAYVVRSPIMLSHYQGGARGTNVRRNRIARGDFLRIPLPLPPLPEQRKIAAILSSVDAAIESTQAVIDQLHVVKKAMMAELLTRGLPGRHSRFKQTEIGEVPESWEVLPLESATRTINVGHVGPTSDGYAATGITFLRTGNIKNGALDLSDLKYITLDFHQRLGKSQIHPGDVLVSRVGNTGGAALVPSGFPEANCANIIVIRPDTQTTPSYLRYFLNGPVAARQSAGFSAGSAQAVLNIGAIKKLLIARPSHEEQDQISELVSVIEERQNADEATLRGLVDAKVSLMSALLTGEIRVKPDEATP